MAEWEPTEVRNLDRYGSPALAWSRARDNLAVPSHTDRFFLGTVGPDGRPHAAGVGALTVRRAPGRRPGTSTASGSTPPSGEEPNGATRWRFDR
jgi:hypothetical protein